MKLYRIGIHEKKLLFSTKSENTTVYDKKKDLMDMKCGIDKCDPRKWEEVKKKHNQYEYIYTSSQVNKNISSICPVKHASSMKDAVERAWELSSNGASIILSPACSSFDMYSNYVERGDNYIRYVEEFLQ